MTQQQRVASRMRLAMCSMALCICLGAALTGCAAFGKCGLRECPADAKISAAVRTLLEQSPALGTPNLISVQTVHGVVYLRGLVSTPYQIAEAGSIAERAPGVTDVQNLLSIDNSR
jgi:osmotically-inducible protein OsmY